MTRGHSPAKGYYDLLMWFDFAGDRRGVVWFSPTHSQRPRGICWLAGKSLAAGEGPRLTYMRSISGRAREWFIIELVAGVVLVTESVVANKPVYYWSLSSISTPPPPTTTPTAGVIITVIVISLYYHWNGCLAQTHLNLISFRDIFTCGSPARGNRW